MMSEAHAEIETLVVRSILGADERRIRQGEIRSQPCRIIIMTTAVQNERA